MEESAFRNTKTASASGIEVRRPESTDGTTFECTSSRCCTNSDEADKRRAAQAHAVRGLLGWLSERRLHG
jgi:hypothetical protein